MRNIPFGSAGFVHLIPLYPLQSAMGKEGAVQQDKPTLF
jgi:hypothetical protein